MSPISLFSFGAATPGTDNESFSLARLAGADPCRQLRRRRACRRRGRSRRLVRLAARERAGRLRDAVQRRPGSAQGRQGPGSPGQAEGSRGAAQPDAVPEVPAAARARPGRVRGQRRRQRRQRLRGAPGRPAPARRRPPAHAEGPGLGALRQRAVPEVGCRHPALPGRRRRRRAAARPAAAGAVPGQGLPRGRQGLPRAGRRRVRRRQAAAREDAAPAGQRVLAVQRRRELRVGARAPGGRLPQARLLEGTDLARAARREDVRPRVRRQLSPEGRGAGRRRRWTTASPRRPSTARTSPRPPSCATRPAAARRRTRRSARPTSPPPRRPRTATRSSTRACWRCSKATRNRAPR